MTPSTARDDRQAKIDAAAPKQRGGRGKLVAAGVVAVLALGGIAYAVSRPSESGPSNLTSGGTGTSTSSGAPVALPKSVTAATAPIVGTAGGAGKAGAPTLTVVEDFQCPVCKVAEDHFGARIRELEKAGKLSVNYYVRPMLDQNYPGENSNRAAQAAAAAADAGKFEEFHDALFAEQPAREGEGYSDETIKAAAVTAGITGPALETWTSAVSTHLYKPYVDGIEAWAPGHLMVGTPHFYANGTVFDVAPTASADEFEKKLNDALAAG